MGLLAKFKNVFGKEKDEEDKEQDSKVVSKEETTKEKQDKKQAEVPEEQLKKIAETSKFASNVDSRLEEIDMGIREIKKEMAKEETLKEVKEDVVNKSTMKDLLENIMLKQGMKYLQGDVSREETANVSKETSSVSEEETKKYIQETSKKKAKEFAEEIDDIEKYKKAKDKVKKALKDQGKVKFGNDDGDYGLTKLTGLERSWIYKVCYLGFDSSGSVKNPAEGTLLDDNKISIDKSGRAFKVMWNK